MIRQVVFDLETTGFKFSEGHRIVEIGAVELDDGRPTGQKFHTYVNPCRNVPDDAVRVHGLTTEFLSDKPVFSDLNVGEAFLDFAGDSVLIAHNGHNFDVPFINAELGHNGLRKLENKLIDTLLLARKLFPGSPASLDALCSRFGISTDIRAREGHGALLDSNILAQVYFELIGGAQRGFDLSSNLQKPSEEVHLKHVLPKFDRERPILITSVELEAHRNFIREIGPKAIWNEILNK